MTEESFWGDLSNLAPQETPFILLQRQADFLRSATLGVLEGRATRRYSSVGRPVEASLHVIAPALQNYSVEILQVRYDASRIYPISMRDFYSERFYAATSESDFEEKLRTVLTSEQVKSVIGNLIAESQLSREG